MLANILQDTPVFVKKFVKMAFILPMLFFWGMGVVVAMLKTGSAISLSASIVVPPYAWLLAYQHLTDKI